MNTALRFGNAEREEQRGEAALWPVLARLPNIAGHAASDLQPPRRRSARSLEYRFDPPLSRPFQRRGEDQAAETVRGNSPILPRSNPFSIPASSLHDAIAPFVRFMMLVALFTIAGTTILMLGKQRVAHPKPAESATIAVQESLEPAAVVAPASSAFKQSASAPTVTGPLGTARLQQIGVSGDAAPGLADWTQSGLENGEAAAAPATKDISLDSPVEAAESAADFLPMPLSSTVRPALPRVQTADPAPAVAHLPGYILELPSRHASHDDQPSLH